MYSAHDAVTSRSLTWLLSAFLCGLMVMGFPDEVAAAEIAQADPPAAQGKVRRLQVSMAPEGGDVEMRVVPLNGDGVAHVSAPQAESRPMRLGVALTDVPEAVRAQISSPDLPAGFGVMVQQVEPGTPAEKAGLERFDILVKFNDQKLVSGQQLVALVNAADNKRPVSLTLLRGGRRQVVKLRLAGDVAGTKAAPEDAGTQAAAAPQKKPSDRPKDHMVIPQIPNLPPNLPPQVQDLLKQLPQNVPFLGNEGFPMQATVSVQSSTVMATDNGTITITDSNGNRTVTIQDTTGKQVFAGPLNSAEEWEQVPEPFRNQLPKP